MLCVLWDTCIVLDHFSIEGVPLAAERVVRGNETLKERTLFWQAPGKALASPTAFGFAEKGGSGTLLLSVASPAARTFPWHSTALTDMEPSAPSLALQEWQATLFVLQLPASL